MSEDAARTNLGTPWRMPTAAEFQELYDNCTHVWTTLNGMNGVLFTSNVNGNRLFFPAAGFYDGTSLDSRGSFGRYWSSTFYSTSSAYLLYFSSSNVDPQHYSGRRIGFSVRAVLEGTPNRSIVPQTSISEPKEEETLSTEETQDYNQR